MNATTLDCLAEFKQILRTQMIRIAGIEDSVRYLRKKKCDTTKQQYDTNDLVREHTKDLEALWAPFDLVSKVLGLKKEEYQAIQEECRAILEETKVIKPRPQEELPQPLPEELLAQFEASGIIKKRRKAA